jgi:hypothetical protein
MVQEVLRAIRIAPMELAGAASQRLHLSQVAEVELVMVRQQRIPSATQSLHPVAPATERAAGQCAREYIA